MLALAGLAVVATVATTVSLVAPVGPGAALALLAFGWIAAVWRRRTLAAKLLGGCCVNSWVFWGAALGLLVGTAFVARSWIPLVDMGLYYVPTVEWLTRASAPTGLGLLHGRLAFNSTWLAAAAGVEAPLLEGRGVFVLNGLLFWAWGATIALSILAWRRRDGALSTVFLACSALPWLTLARGNVLGTATADFAVVALTVVETTLSLRILESAGGRGRGLGLALVLAAFAATVKLSAAAVAVGPLVAYAWAERDRLRLIPKRPLFGLVLVCAAILVPWMVRGLLLSGCLAYPSPVGCVDALPWTVPPSQVENERIGVLAFGRQAGGYLGNAAVGWDWLPSWLADFARNLRVRLVAALLVGSLVVWVAAGRRQVGGGRGGLLAVALVGPIVGLAWWFATAPNIRFGEGPLWCLGLLAVVAAVDRVSAAIPDALDRARGTVVAGGSVALAVAWLALFARYGGLVGAAGLATWPQLPQPTVQAREVRGGEVYVPSGTDQCWATPLPCTPYFNSDLVILPGPDGVPSGVRLASRP